MIFQLAEDAPGNPWLNVVIISKVEPLWFGKRDPEKRLKFHYGSSSWHKRLVASAGSGNSSSDRNGTAHTNEEKGHWNGSNWSPDSQDAIITNPPPRGRTRPEESPVDRHFHRGISPTTNFTTPATSDHERSSSDKKLQSGARRASSSHSTSYFPAFATFDHPSNTNNTSFPIPPQNRFDTATPDSNTPPEPAQWTDVFAPAPIVPRTRSTSRTRSVVSHASPLMRRTSHNSDIDIANNALNRILNPDLFPRETSATEPSSPPHQRQQHHRTISASSASSFYGSRVESQTRRASSRDSIEYPGVLAGDEADRRRSSTTRETQLPDGVYEVVQGRIRQVSVSGGRPRTESRGRYEARDAGRAR